MSERTKESEVASQNPQSEFAALFEQHRQELQLHCYRMLGSLRDAEDMVQETMLRAWRGLDNFRGDASLRTWLYKIATNVCLDLLDRQQRRALPAQMGAPADPNVPAQPPLSEVSWLEPYPDDLLADQQSGPEAHLLSKERVSLAFTAALQLLPPRQRAVLILRDALDWSARDVAQLLDMTVSAANSAVHRARTRLSQNQTGELAALPAPHLDAHGHALLQRYVRAWETANVEELVKLLREDAIFSMPPVAEWYLGRDAIRAVLLAVAFPDASAGRWKLLPTYANGQPAFAVYESRDASEALQPLGIQVLTLDTSSQGWLIGEIITFMKPELFAKFGLPTAPNLRDLGF